MHERQYALTGAILALTFLTAVPARAEKDAAIKAQEGSVDHWIEFYRKNQQQPRPVAPAPQGAVVEEERAAVKAESEKGKVEWQEPAGQQ